MPARWMRIELAPAARARGYFRLVLADGRARYAPAPGLLPFVVRLEDGAELAVEAAEGRIERLSPYARARAALRLAFGVWRGAELRFPGAALFPDGSRAAARRFRKQIEAARRHLSAWDGPLLAAHPEIVAGWPFVPAGRPPVGRPRIAVAVHLYYTELWDEFETLLGRWRSPFRLLLTLNAENPQLQARARTAFPDICVKVVENRGRDVRPFLLWLEEGAFAGFDLVCKLHGKRSFGGGRLPAFGDALRRANLYDLIADPDRVEKMVARFDAEPDLGLVGSGRFLVASGRQAPRDVLGENRAAVERLAARLEAPLFGPEFDFFEGTMFWARPAALAPLAALGLSHEAFAPEAGRTDGAVEHALERLFNHVARKAGFRVGTTMAD